MWSQWAKLIVVPREIENSQGQIRPAADEPVAGKHVNLREAVVGEGHFGFGAAEPALVELFIVTGLQAAEEA